METMIPNFDKGDVEKESRRRDRVRHAGYDKGQMATLSKTNIDEVTSGEIPIADPAHGNTL